jgi:glycosyltransferase involved in cell wall biosynthesis
LKKILILAYDFPPFNSVGAQRPYGWYKYFINFNLYPIVVTRHWDENILNEIDCVKPSLKQSVDIEKNNLGTIIRVPFNPNLRDKLLLKYGFNKYNSIRKLITFCYSLLRFVSFKIDNTSNLYFAADNYIKNNKCDFIIATGEPFILFRYAYILSGKHKIKWFADYRDGWSTNLAVNSIPFYRIFIYKYLNKYFEKKYCSTSECIFTVSQFAKDQLSELFKNKSINLCPNGFFEEDYEDSSGLSQDKEKFIISYIGNIYPYQPLELFLESVEEFILDRKLTNVRIIFYGLTFYKSQEDRVLNFSPAINEYIITTQRMPKNLLIRELKKSHLLLLLASNSVDGSCAKVYEYLPLNRKILLIKNDKGILEKIIDNCNAGYKCSSKREITDVLNIIYDEFCRTGDISQQTINFESYTRKVQTSLMANLILNC